MEENVGGSDRLARIAVGAIVGAVSLALLGPVESSGLPLGQYLSPVLGVVALVLLGTGYTRKCYLYNVLGMNTRE